MSESPNKEASKLHKPAGYSGYPSSPPPWVKNAVEAEEVEAEEVEAEGGEAEGGEAEGGEE